MSDMRPLSHQIGTEETIKTDGVLGTDGENQGTNPPAETSSGDKTRLHFCETLLDEYEYVGHPSWNMTDDLAANIRREAETRRNRKQVEADKRIVFSFEDELDFDSRQLAPLFTRIAGASGGAKRISDADGDSAAEGIPADESARSSGVDSTTNGKQNGGSLRLDPRDRPTNDIAGLRDKLWGSGEKSREVLSALCLSGGGIRSATFNLGILQGLARHGLLERFHYLSTVSGGGFIGGWLTAWLHREGTAEVMRGLGKADAGNKPDKGDAANELGNSGAWLKPFAPEAKPINHLRSYSNFLSPRPGLFSLDTWTLIASVSRNLLLIWLIFVPWLVFMLLAPRLWVSIILYISRQQVLPYQYATPVSLWVGIITAWLSFGYMCLRLPLVELRDQKHAPKSRGDAAAEGDLEVPRDRFLLRCLLPMVISAMCLTIYWAQVRTQGGMLDWEVFVFVTEVSALVPWCVAATLIIKNNRSVVRTSLIRRLVGATALIAAAQFITGLLFWYGIDNLPTKPSGDGHKFLFYATFGVPLVLLIDGLGGTLIAGFTSRYADDNDQEWWARAGGWLLRAALVWVAVHLIVIYGPLLFSDPGRLLDNRFASEKTVQYVGSLVGVISGVITLYGSFSARTAAHEREGNAGRTGGLMSWLTNLVAPIFCAFVFIAIAFATDYLLPKLVSLTGLLTSWWTSPTEWQTASTTESHIDHLKFVVETPLHHLVAAAVLVAVFGCLMSRLINSNRFSLHAMWRNRIVRAYRGASHTKRDPNSFTDFDSSDNIHLHELRKRDTRHPRPLLHVINIALNLTGGAKLQWQERKAESFTATPLHCGSYWLGYRDSQHYGGEHGLSLGTAVAVSGAFVSPNMGYMMSSPVVRFLMTLFNVRFGWWLGNPGAAGESTNRFERWWERQWRRIGWREQRPFQRAAPYLSALPIIQEAAGRTNDHSPYVYLSDGGHFDNLGLYEMVLRRARFVVVSDASTDPDYAFQSLAASIRQIRVDFGIPVEFDDFSISGPAQDFAGKHCAVGRIRYSCIDRRTNDRTDDDDNYDGILIYIKPSLIGAEPRDVVNYSQGSRKFPQEVITDQWFSEAQFESYRALGSYIVNAILDTKNSQAEIEFRDFARRAEAHNQLDFRHFRKQIDYAAFEHEFINGLGEPPPSDVGFGTRVREYMRRVVR